MKTVVLFLSLILSIALISAMKLPVTPKGNDLSNHYGTAPASESYGPKSDSQGLNVKRRGEAPGVGISPISNFNQEIDPTQVISGNLDNIAVDATTILNPTLASPKVSINTNLVHDAVVKTPVQIGTDVERTKITTMDRETGQVDVVQNTVKKPILAILETPKSVTTNFDTTVDLSTGTIVTPSGDKQLLGIDSA